MGTPTITFGGPTYDFFDQNPGANPATNTYPWVTNQCGILHYLTTGQAQFDGCMYPVSLAAGSGATALIACANTTPDVAFNGGLGMRSIAGLPGFKAVNQYGAVYDPQNNNVTMGNITRGDVLSISLTSCTSWATPLFYITQGPSGYACAIQDAVVKNFIVANDSRVSDWLDLLDQDINYKAMEYGLLTSQILLPLHPRIMEYARAYFCLMVFRDNIGVNDVNTYANEKYMVGYGLFSRETERTRKLLSRDIFWLQDMAIRGINRTGGSCDLVRG
jgi:hypothetical protein